MVINSFSRDGREMVLATLEPSDCFGDLGLVTETMRINDPISGSRTVVNFLQKKDFLALCDEHPEILKAMNRVLAFRFEFLFSLIQDACLLPLYERLQRIIVRLGVNRGTRQADGVIRIDDCTQEMLGKMVGAARQSVSRELKKMEQLGHISVEHKCLVIQDLDALVKESQKSIDYEPVTTTALAEINGN